MYTFLTPQTKLKRTMKKSLILSALCMALCLVYVQVSRSAVKPHAKVTDTTCGWYDSFGNKYYCVETSASCTVAHAYVSEQGSTATPTLVILSLISTSGSCKTFEGSLVLPSGNTMVIDVITCDCGITLTTHVRFVKG
jgi:hypothetical protein